MTERQAAAHVAPPSSEAQVLARSQELAGHTVGELANMLGLVAPPDQRRAKGFVGRLLEQHLGATAKSRAVPDFAGLAIELKSLPLDGRHRPKESTFVCRIAPDRVVALPFLESRVWMKLQRVLWVPVEAVPRMPLPERRIGRAFLWSPTPSQARVLEADWEDLREVIARGDLEQLTGHFGRALQVRPKAAHGRVRQRGHDDGGAPLLQRPRGFYLRTSFTAAVLREQAQTQQDSGHDPRP